MESNGNMGFIGSDENMGNIGMGGMGMENMGMKNMINAMMKNSDIGKYPKKKGLTNSMFDLHMGDNFSAQKIPHFGNDFLPTQYIVPEFQKYDPILNNSEGQNGMFQQNYDDNTIASSVNTPIKKTKNKNKKTNDEVVGAMIGLYDHLKGDIKNKNKYDVLYEIVKCNEAIIKNGLLLNENKINTIISSNLKIAELCGAPDSPNDVDLEIEEISNY